MSDLSFERFRQDKNGAKLIMYINMCRSNVEINRIKGLNLTYFFAFFSES